MAGEYQMDDYYVLRLFILWQELWDDEKHSVEKYKFFIYLSPQHDQEHCRDHTKYIASPSGT